MNLKQQLTAGDPVAREPQFDEFHARTMRQRVLLEARTAEREGAAAREGFSRAFGWWLRPVAVAAAMAVCLMAGILIGMRINSSSAAQPLPGPEERPRQVQFSTPGGTRIIWTLHQDLDL
jgi:hypothetical protein